VIKQLQSTQSSCLFDVTLYILHALSLLMLQHIMLMHSPSTTPLKTFQFRHIHTINWRYQTVACAIFLQEFSQRHRALAVKIGGVMAKVFFLVLAHPVIPYKGPLNGCCSYKQQHYSTEFERNSLSETQTATTNTTATTTTTTTSV